MYSSYFRNFEKLILLIVLLCSFSTIAQNQYTISGYVTDKSSGESIVGTNIYSKDLNVGVSSNTYGFYSLTLPEGTHNISFSFIGYKRIDKEFILNKDQIYNAEFELSSKKSPSISFTPSILISFFLSIPKIFPFVTFFFIT